MEERLLRYNKTSNFTFIDLETFNLCLSFCHNRPWQGAMVKLKGGVVQESYSQFIKWQTHLKISAEAAAITRFDKKKYDAEAIPEEQFFEVMFKWLEEADYICGHNVLGFDIFLIKEWYRLKGKNPEPLFNKIIDTNIIGKAIKMGIAPNPSKSMLAWQYPIMNLIKKDVKTRLEILGKEYEIEHDYANLHDAIVDLQLNVKVWEKQKQLIPI